MQFKQLVVAVVGAATLTTSAAIEERAYDVVTSIATVDHFPAVSISTVYSTTEVTIYSCASSVTNCPLSGSASTYTSVVPVSTTICPATLTSMVSAAAAPTYTPGSLPQGGSSVAGAGSTGAPSNTGSVKTVYSTVTRSWSSTVTIGAPTSSMTSSTSSSSTLGGSGGSPNGNSSACRLELDQQFDSFRAHDAGGRPIKCRKHHASWLLILANLIRQCQWPSDCQLAQQRSVELDGFCKLFRKCERPSERYWSKLRPAGSVLASKPVWRRRFYQLVPCHCFKPRLVLRRDARCWDQLLQLRCFGLFTGGHAYIQHYDHTSVSLPAQATMPSSFAGGIANNATMPVPTSSFGGYGPYLPPPGAGATSSSSNAIGAIGATGSASMGMPMPSSNGTITSPTASIVPYTGDAAIPDMNHRLMLCFAIGIVTTILLV